MPLPQTGAAATRRTVERAESAEEAKYSALRALVSLEDEEAMPGTLETTEETGSSATVREEEICAMDMALDSLTDDRELTDDSDADVLLLLDEELSDEMEERGESDDRLVENVKSREENVKEKLSDEAEEAVLKIENELSESDEGEERENEEKDDADEGAFEDKGEEAELAAEDESEDSDDAFEPVEPVGPPFELCFELPPLEPPSSS